MEPYLYYVDKIVAASGLKDIKPVSTPMAITSSPMDDTPLTEEDTSLFRELNGMIGWMSATIRPDVAYAFSRAGQHNAKPTVGALQNVLYAVRYLAGTRNYGNTAKASRSSADFKFYCDADHAGNAEAINRRRSQLSFIVTQGGAPIAWKSTANSTSTASAALTTAHPALSSGEAEIFAASDATKLLLHLSYIADEMHIPDWPKPMKLLCDAAVAITFMDNSASKSRLKHIDVRQQWVKQLRDTNLVVGVKVPTKDNLADIGTKILGPQIFIPLRDQMLKSIEVDKVDQL